MSAEQQSNIIILNRLGQHNHLVRTFLVLTHLISVCTVGEVGGCGHVHVETARVDHSLYLEPKTRMAPKKSVITLLQEVSRNLTTQ